MSNLTVYFRSVTCSGKGIDRYRNKYVYNEMISFPETKAEKLMCTQELKFFVKYHRVQFSRVYPKGQRIDSSNYNPVPMWNTGCQMAALNYQTGDKPMQLNQAKFRENGNCGYLLKPDFMFHDNYDPTDKNPPLGVDTFKITLHVIGARHLNKPGRGTASPFVQIEIVGTDLDSGVKLTTKTISKCKKFFFFFRYGNKFSSIVKRIQLKFLLTLCNNNITNKVLICNAIFSDDNGFNPFWNESCEFLVTNPYLAFIRFVVQDEDMFGDSNFMGQATYPVNLLQYSMTFLS